jgi:HK97 family phage portal protein
MAIQDAFKSLYRRFMTAKAMPGAIGGGMPGYAPVTDAFRRRAQPTKRQLLDSTRGFAFACIQKNAQGTAQVPIRLYARTNAEQATVNKGGRSYSLEFKDVDTKTLEYLRDESSPYVRQFVSKFANSESNNNKLKEITGNHLILDLLKNVNPWMNQYELFYLLQFELDVCGEHYWYPATNNAGGVSELWPLEAWRMKPLPSLDGTTPLVGYEYSGQRAAAKYLIDELIVFRYVSPHDPYGTGFSPIRAAFEYVELANELHAYESALVNNRARPDIMITPKDVISRGMAQRLETRITERFRRGGAGGVLVGEFGYDMRPFVYSPTDLGNVALRKSCEEITAACLDVPLSLVRVEDVNRANADAGHYQHAKLAIRPRCIQIEQKLNEKFVPLFDDKLLIAFDNPVPEDADRRRNDRTTNLAAGVTSINEERQKEGLPPIKGGEEPLVNPQLVPLSKIKDLVKMTMEAPKIPPGGGGGPSGGNPRFNKAMRVRVRSYINDRIQKAIEEERLAYQEDSDRNWPDLVGDMHHAE